MWEAPLKQSRATSGSLNPWGRRPAVGEWLRKALAGEPGPVYDAAVLGAALTLWHIGAEPDMLSATKKARNAISSGAAAERLDAGL